MKTEWIRGEKAIQKAMKGRKLFINKNGTWVEADASALMTAQMLPPYALFVYGVKRKKNEN